MTNESAGHQKSSLAARACNIGLRTTHIAATGMLVGGHYFDMPRDRLYPLLYLTIASGIALVIAEAYPDWHWPCELRGWFVFAKIAVISLILWQWKYRVAWLLIVLTIGSFGSHIPKQFRYLRVIPGKRQKGDADKI